MQSTRSLVEIHNTRIWYQIICLYVCLFWQEIITLTRPIRRKVWNLPHKFHLYLITLKYTNLNESKTDLCLFYRGDTTPITVTLYGQIIKSNKSINILGVIFDSKLQWSEHISHSIKRSMKALNAIRLIRKFFTKRELLSLITSNFLFNPLL